MMYNDILDSHQFHNSEIIEGAVVFPGAKSPHYVTVNYEAAGQRNLEYIRENIRQSRKREAKNEM